MPESHNETLTAGVVTSRDPTHLSAGELQRAIGCWYKPGDTQRIWKQRGRTVFGDTGSAAKIKGVALLQFDDGGDLLVALSGTTLYGATPGLSGSFSSIRTGLSSSATRLSAAQYANRFYLATDAEADRMFVVEDGGTDYEAGMQPYPLPPTVSVSAAGGTVIRPGATSGDMTSSSLSNDNDLETYGVLEASAIATKTQTWTWSTGGSASRDLIIQWALQGLGFYGDDPISRRAKDSGAAITPGYDVTLKLEISVDNGANYTTIQNQRTFEAEARQSIQYNVGTVNPGATPCILRATLTYERGQNNAAWRFYDVRMQTGAAGTNFSTTTGFYYAATELDQTRGVRSPAKNVTSLVTLSSQNQVTLTRPTIANTRATHWEIWRTSDGGTPPYDLGLLDKVPIAQTTYKDDFSKYGSTESPPFKIPMLQITSDSGTILVEQDQPPPSMTRVMSFQGSLIGINGRSLRYSLAGLPESWPEIYGISSFESEEHDELVTGSDLGELFVIAGTANIRRIATLPRVTIGNFAYSPPEIIPAAPGCVGPYAMTKFSVAGEARVAWISHYGIYQSNGYQVQRISDDWDWSAYEGFDKSGWVIHYDKERFVLVVAYSATEGENDRYALGHVHPSHLKAENQPKWTIDHYGDIADLCSGQVSSQRRMYSGHTSNGIVYTEDEGETDASMAYNSDGDWPLDILTRRIHGGGREFSALKAWLRHSDFGTAQEATITWTHGRDESSSASRSITCSLEDQRRTLFDVARGGEWHEARAFHDGAATGSLGELAFEVRPLGGQGVVKVA